MYPLFIWPRDFYFFLFVGAYVWIAWLLTTRKKTRQ